MAHLEQNLAVELVWGLHRTRRAVRQTHLVDDLKRLVHERNCVVTSPLGQPHEGGHLVKHDAIGGAVVVGQRLQLRLGLDGCPKVPSLHSTDANRKEFGR